MTLNVNKVILKTCTIHLTTLCRLICFINYCNYCMQLWHLKLILTLTKFEFIAVMH